MEVTAAAVRQSPDFHKQTPCCLTSPGAAAAGGHGPVTGGETQQPDLEFLLPGQALQAAVPSLNQQTGCQMPAWRTGEHLKTAEWDPVNTHPPQCETNSTNTNMMSIAFVI